MACFAYKQADKTVEDVNTVRHDNGTCFAADSEKWDNDAGEMRAAKMISNKRAANRQRQRICPSASSRCELKLIENKCSAGMPNLDKQIDVHNINNMMCCEQRIINVLP